MEDSKNDGWIIVGVPTPPPIFHAEARLAKVDEDIMGLIEMEQDGLTPTYEDYAYAMVPREYLRGLDFALEHTCGDPEHCNADFVKYAAVITMADKLGLRETYVRTYHAETEDALTRAVDAGHITVGEAGQILEWKMDKCGENDPGV